MTAQSVIAQSFGRAAARYREHARVQQAMAEWLAAWAPAPDDRTGRALELGAGPGVLTERLQPWPGPFVATDLSAAMCAEGARRLPQIDWRAAPAEQPPAGPWDWIFTSSMLQWVSEPGQVLAACRQVLTPGGRLVGALFAAPTLPEWNALTELETPLRWRTPGRWEELIGGAGLRLVRAESLTRPFEFPSARALARSLHAVGAAPDRRLPSGRLRRLLAEYDERHHSPSGVSSTWTFFRFEATR